MKNLGDKDRHFLQWHVLSSLQKCACENAYAAEKARLYEMARTFPSRSPCYYLVFLLEETRRDERTGRVCFSDKIKRPKAAPPPEGV